MIVFDIDHFKHVNDTLGHLEGDRTLTQVATIVRRCLRESDEFIRWGGDEFIILFDIKAQEVIHIANRMLESVEKETMVSLSIGITDILINDSFKSAMDRADLALYDAKKSGRNQIKVR
jgi:diguanylate cyclase (GGDEF)-like protein